MSIKHVTKNTFETEVSKAKGVVFVDFYADWCGPCKLTEPIIEEMSKDPQFNNVSFVKVDVDQDNELSASYNILSIPTFIIFKDGALVTQFTGARDRQGFESVLKQALV